MSSETETETAPVPAAAAIPDIAPTEAAAATATATPAVPVETAVVTTEEPQQTKNEEPTAAATEPTKTPETADKPAAETDPATEAPKEPEPPKEGQWPALEQSHILVTFLKRLPEIKTVAEHDEVWGVTLHNPSDGFNTFLKKQETKPTNEKIPSSHLPGVPQMNILQKFLRANKNDLEKAVKQLTDTLAWRRSFQPRKAAFEEIYDEKLFGRLGYITEIPVAGKKTVIVWNIYGAVEDKKKTFGDLETFMKWRVGLMEASLEPLDLPNATERIPDYDPAKPTVDPFQATQVHDYLNLSFLRQDPSVKAASKKVIEVMSSFYPELLSRKFFVNVPVLMQWVFNTIKMVLPKETVAKFMVVSYGEQLHKELSEGVPKEYGGKGEPLKEWEGADYTLRTQKNIGAKPNEEATVPVTTEPTATVSAAAPEPAQTEEKKVEEPTPTGAAEAKPEETKTDGVQPAEVAKGVEDLTLNEKKPEAPVADAAAPIV